MAQGSFNVYLPQNQNYFYEWCGQNVLRDNLVRTQLSYSDFKLTATQMDGAFAAAISILSAPGAGLVNIVDSIVTYVAAGATPFELGSSNLAYLYTDKNGAAVSSEVTNAVVETATTAYYFSVGAAVVPVVNAAIVAWPKADVTAGDGTVYGRIFYKTVKVAELLY